MERDYWDPGEDSDDFTLKGDLGIPSSPDIGASSTSMSSLDTSILQRQRVISTSSGTVISQSDCFWDTASESATADAGRMTTLDVVGCLRRVFYSEPCLVHRIFHSDNSTLFQENGLPGTTCDQERPEFGYSLDEEITQMVSRGSKHIAELEQSTDCVADSDMEVCKELLKSKYMAANILLKQLAEENDEKLRQFEDTKHRCEDLVSELNRLQFEIHSNEQRVLKSQDEWIRKVSALEQENSVMKADMLKNSKRLKTLSYENEVLKREREELMSLIDVKERDVYLRSSDYLHSVAECDEKCVQYDDEHESRSNYLKIAMLAACRCRNSSQESCACARAVAFKQSVLDETITQLKQQEEELSKARRTADIYHEAFETQLSRNRELMKELSLLKNNRDALSRISSSLSWTAKQRKERHVIQSLVDSLCETNEALEHQQIMVKLLAQQLQIQNMFPEDKSCKAHKS